jgi:hypothetical protein
MRVSPGPALATGLAVCLFAFTCTPALHAQTLEVQTKVEARLWFQRWLDRAGSPEGLTTITVFVAIAAALLLVAAWRRARKRGG